jgi:Cu(I)/Ag(I) efflux system membrane protein CusA/SilA
LSITLVPSLRLLFTRVRNFHFHPRWLCRPANATLFGRIHQERDHPISCALIRLYEPVVSWSLRRKRLVIGGALALVLATIPVFIPVFWKLGSEFMPPLDEGSLLYMPSTVPGISIGEAQRALQATDSILREFPEVDRVPGESGAR